MLKRSFRHLLLLTCLASATAAIASPASAQTYPSGMIRIVVPSPRRHAAGHHGPPHCRASSAKAKAGAPSSRTSPARSRRSGLPRCSGSPLTATPCFHRLPASAAPALLPNVKLPARRRFCAGHQACIGIPRAGRPSLGASKVARRVRRAAQEPAGQADVFLGRLRHAGAPRGRNVQAADRRTRHPCALSGAAARDCRPDQRHKPVPVHHAAAGARSDRYRESCARSR